MNHNEAVALNEKLQQASKSYYSLGQPVMSDKEYDALYNQLEAYEKATNDIVPNSIIHQVGYEVVSKLKKEEHEKRALSLNKTKDPAQIVAWARNENVVLSWKLDGLTLVATYDNGKLTKLVTRGNGTIGENVTHNAPYVHGLPMTIPYTDYLVVRGEALISYDTLNRINASLKDGVQKYTTARSLASGSVRKLDSREAASRNIEFKAFELVQPKSKTFTQDLAFLSTMHFDTVPYASIPAESIPEGIASFTNAVSRYGYPVDGLVFMIDDLQKARARGTTDKYPNWGMAFKWQDETYQTTVRKIDWQTSRTGRINPVVIFDTVEIDNTQVSRATGNNISFLNEKGIAPNSVVEVYKANMIIPTIDKVVANPARPEIPAQCPVCGAPTTIRQGADGSQVLYCTNPDCAARKLKQLSHYVSRNALNIVGLSESTLEKLVQAHYITTPDSIFEILDIPVVPDIEGFGEKSYEALQQAIETARTTTLDRVIYAMGIPNVGKKVAKDIAKAMNYDYNNFYNALYQGFNFATIEGIGTQMNEAIYDFFCQGDNLGMYVRTCSNLNFVMPSGTIEPAGVSANTLASSQPFSGLTFCITGKVFKFKNRNEASEWIESLGGTVTGSVTGKTNYLINNDVTSTSGKNKKAQQLGVPILSEEDLLHLAGI
jgi:DNA ligase (NAD+)